MIEAKIIKDSISYDTGKRITTFELEYPRFIHAEVLTHRVFSRNAQSSRAVPIEKTIEFVKNSPAMPVYWGANKAGMQANTEVQDVEAAKAAWIAAAQDAVKHAHVLKTLGLHKQIVNRILEPFQTIKVVLTGTEFENFFWLRLHEAAQPEIQLLALKMLRRMQESKPQELYAGEWHLPYIDTIRDFSKDSDYPGDTIRYECNGEVISLETAKKISASCCAQVSYRKLDSSEEKAENIYDMLVSADRVHASPFEHQATPLSSIWMPTYCNFVGWIQARHKIPLHYKKG